MQGVSEQQHGVFVAAVYAALCTAAHVQPSTRQRRTIYSLKETPVGLMSWPEQLVRSAIAGEAGPMVAQRPAVSSIATTYASLKCKLGELLQTTLPS